MELNCPFCGSAPLIFEAEDEYACGNQACFMFSCCATKEEWNRRASDDLLAALKELADSVDGITVGETCEEEQRVWNAWQAARAAIARREHE